MRWIKDLNTKIENLTFELGGQHIWAKYNDHATSKASFVTWVVYAKEVAKVKLQCAYAIEKLICELGNRFPLNESMDVLGVVYPQYWLGIIPKTSFQMHLNVINMFMVCQKKMVYGGLDFISFGPYSFGYATIFICFDNEEP